MPATITRYGSIPGVVLIRHSSIPGAVLVNEIEYSEEGGWRDDDGEGSGGVWYGSYDRYGPIPVAVLIRYCSNPGAVLIIWFDSLLDYKEVKDLDKVEEEQ